MASQLVSDVRCQRPMHCATSYGERGSGGFLLSRSQSYGYHRIRNQSRIQPEDNFKEHNIGRENGAKRSINLSRQQAQKLHKLGFSYLASSFVYLVTKVKAFYNGFLGDVASESRMGVEAPMAGPYFSVPVLPN
ncbi:uncharacterized protein LOC133303935 [Gastrolobium bilobum]|uniref:uncharacterized protein LOC133303935 n=1 Tax=Gastrolobium bilobum TaxID=150636 RepID=UPI002AAF500A|nr:uncharacterized protein LOC133303935 [Gastrolobium bilobum]